MSARVGVGVSALLAVLAAACGGTEVERSTEAKPLPAVELSGLRRPGTPPAYWLGERFEGLPLAANAGTVDEPTFVYGTCTVSPGSDGGCAPPLQLQHWPLAERAPARFEVAPGRRTSCRLPSVVGITAAIFETTGGVEVYLGERVVVLFGDRALIRKAMSDLRPVRRQQPNLPPPPAWVHDQLRRCAPPSPDAKLRELRATGGPALYWLGNSYEGHPLATAEGDAEEATLVYGECARDELAFDTACWPPLEIRVGPLKSL